MDNQLIINNRHRLYILAYLLSSDARSSAGKVELVFRNLHEQYPDSILSIRKMIDALELLEFGITGSVDTPIESVATRAHILGNSVRPDILTADEAARFVNARIGVHILNLSKRGRFDLWVGVQDDLPERRVSSEPYIQAILSSIQSEFTPTESQVYAPVIDTTVILTACRSYFSSLETRVTGQQDYHSKAGQANPVESSSGESATDELESGRIRRSKPFSFKRSLLYGILIVVGAYSANWLYRAGLPGPPERDIIQISIQAADLNSDEFPTNSKEQAERYIFDRLGTTVQAPEIESAILTGVDFVDLPSEMSTAAFIYKDELTDEDFPVFVYSYLFLQKNRQNVDVSPQILRRIEDASKFGVRMTDEYSALVWRHRDDIFIAVVQTNPDEMMDRIVIL